MNNLIRLEPIRLEVKHIGEPRYVVRAVPFIVSWLLIAGVTKLVLWGLGQ